MLFRSWQVIGAFGAAYAGGYLALPAPAGIGVREGLLVALLAGSVPTEDLVALAVVQRVLITVSELVPVPILLARRSQKALK